MHQNQEFRFNEVLFEHRNKEYGAYALRNESDKILTKALFIGVGLLAAVSLTPLAVNAFKNPEMIETEIYELPPPVIIEEYDETPPVKVLPLKITTVPNVKTYDSSVPTPSRTAPDTHIEKVPHDAIAGLKDNFKADPAPTDTYVPSMPIIHTGPVSVSTPPRVVPKTDDADGIPTVVDVEASFMGGIDTFRNKVMNNFDGSGMESDDVMKTTITFIVEKDGTISGLKAEGKDADFNSEALRTVKSIKGRWVPAKVKGQPVRSYFKFPITMKFEG